MGSHSIPRIVVFDSGIGGFKVADNIRQLLIAQQRQASIVYIGDYQNFPYGNKSPRDIVRHSSRIMTMAARTGADLIVSACNTASSNIGHLKIQIHGKFPTRVVRMIEPAAIEIVNRMPDGSTVGIVGTPVTINSGAYQRCLGMQADLERKRINVIPVSCPGLAAAIENTVETSKARRLVQHLIKNRLDQANAVILGCTHYPAVADQILDAAHNNPLIIDPAEVVANHAIKVLSRFVRFPPGETSFSACFTTADAKNPHVRLGDSAIFRASGIAQFK